MLCCRQHNPIDQLERYSRWRAEGENSVNGRCFDIGRTVSKALREFKGSSSPYPGGQDHYSAGNGSLMRLAPLVLFYSTHVSTRDTASAIVHLLEMSAFSSMTTHRHPLAVREGANKRGNSSRLTQSFHFFMFEPIFSPVNALNQPI
ncbi:ADP-ribosylglycohydrolase family protein [Aeromonas sanarellii]|nr:ADP-ribosylglycohydrolase family protein [Aeromonas sanarellii]